jgi:hypothetical protein
VELGVELGSAVSVAPPVSVSAGSVADVVGSGGPVADVVGSGGPVADLVGSGGPVADVVGSGEFDWDAGWLSDVGSAPAGTLTA